MSICVARPFNNKLPRANSPFRIALGAISLLPLLGLLPCPYAKSQPPDKKAALIEPQQLIEDFRILRSALEEGHSGIYRYTSKPDLDAKFDQAEKVLNRAMTPVEFYRLVAPVVAAVKCGHTDVALPFDDVRAGPQAEKPLLPLQVRVLGDKVYIFRDFSNDKGELAGQEIYQINGMDAGAIVATMAEATPSDGDTSAARLYRLRGWGFSSRLVDLIGLEPPYVLKLWDPEQKKETMHKLAAVEPAKLKEAALARFPQDQRPKDAATLKFVEDNKIAVLKINQFGGVVGPDKKSLRDFIQESFAAIKKNETTTLILDLRDNGGGADDLGKLLLSYLVDKPFKYYDDLVVNALDFSFRKYAVGSQSLPEKLFERSQDGKYHLVKHPNWGEHQPSTPGFTGKLFILINAGSFSTTSEFLSHVHFRKRATFIGEESAGGYYGNTSGPRALITLPNTKVKLLVPLLTYYIAVSGNPAAAHGVLPDHPVTYTIKELLDGTDKEMALAMELAHKK
jgi:hypothetical protein